MFEIEKNALNQLAAIAADGYSLRDSRFDRLNAWTYLIMLLDESQRCLDLSEKYNSLASIDTMEQVLVAQSLFRTAIICYGKCFASAGAGRITLDKKQVFKGEKELRVAHEHMIDIRNSFAAHNDNNNIDIAVIATKENTREILIKHTYTLATPLNEYNNYRSVISHCSEYVVLGINKYLDRLQRDLGKTIRFG